MTIKTMFWFSENPKCLLQIIGGNYIETIKHTKITTHQRNKRETDIQNMSATPL